MDLGYITDAQLEELFSNLPDLDCTTSACIHPEGFKAYEGFTDRFEYCPICDHKKND